MRRALTSTATAAVLAVCAGLASAQARTHVRDVRVGAHGDYQRVVVELDGQADIAWERGPAEGEESFYLDADLGRRERLVATKLAQVGTVKLEAMRVGTRVSLEPRERRVRAYLLSAPTRLVIDVAPPGPEEFAVPKGLTALAPAKSIGSLKTAPIPPPPEPEPSEARTEPAKPATEPAPHAEPAPGEPMPPDAAAKKPEPPPDAAAGEPAAEPNAVEAPAEAGSGEPDGAAPPAEAGAEPSGAEAGAAEPNAAEQPGEAAAPETEPPAPPVTAMVQPPRTPAPESLPPDAAFPWLMAVAAVTVAALVLGLGLALRNRAGAEPVLEVRPRRPTPLGVDDISSEELRFAADQSGALEQRLDQEVRARVVLEERLAEASEELKVLRDRVHRVERRRDEEA